MQVRLVVGQPAPGRGCAMAAVRGCVAGRCACLRRLAVDAAGGCACGRRLVRTIARGPGVRVGVMAVMLLCSCGGLACRQCGGHGLALALVKVLILVLVRVGLQLQRRCAAAVVIGSRSQQANQLAMNAKRPDLVGGLRAGLPVAAQSCCRPSSGVCADWRPAVAATGVVP